MSRPSYRLVSLAIALLAAGAAQAQLLPSIPSLPFDTARVPGVDALTQGASRVTTAAAQSLERAREATLDRLVRDHPDRIARDPDGNPARAGEVVVSDPTPRLITAATAHGYTLIARDDVLGIGFARLRIPEGRSFRTAITELRRLGGGEIVTDTLHLQSGATGGATVPLPPPDDDVTVGVIDGGVAGAQVVQGFASGAPVPNDHATAVASLIAGRNGARGALPGARIASADVYGQDPAGGNVTAIARAIGWMVTQHVPVVTISLVGPPNPLLARVVAAAQARGLVIVAAVGNDGPAAPPAYPASYPGVIAVTAVDGRDRALIEAGRATHLDYAAPGADMLAIGADGRAFRVRGTSFAAPLVAGTIASLYRTPAPDTVRGVLARVDAGARDLGARGPDRIYGRGLVCAACRTPVK